MVKQPSSDDKARAWILHRYLLGAIIPRSYPEGLLGALALVESDVSSRRRFRAEPLFLVRESLSFDSGSDEELLEAGELLTAAEVGEILRVNPKKVYELAIPQVRLSTRRIRFLRADVFAYIQRNRTSR